MLQPYGNRILLRKINNQKTQTDSGIFLPDSIASQNPEGEVVAVGDGTVVHSGQRIPTRSSVGDIVIYQAIGGVDLKIGEENLTLISEDHVFGKWDKG